MRPMLTWIEHEREAISARTKAGAGPKLPIMEPGSSADDASAKGDGGLVKRKTVPETADWPTVPGSIVLSEFKSEGGVTCSLI